MKTIKLPILKIPTVTLLVLIGYGAFRIYTLRQRYAKFEVEYEVPNVNAEDVIINLSRGGCFGYCPVYNLNIYKNGNVEYDGKQFVTKMGKHKLKLNATQLAQIYTELEKANFFNIPKENYVNFDATDMASIDITAKATFLEDEVVVKHVYYYLGDQSGPKQLIELVANIEKITGVSEFIMYN